MKTNNNSTSQKKDKIIACKVSQEEKELLEKMALHERRSINNFVINSALSRKEEILGENN